MRITLAIVGSTFVGILIGVGSTWATLGDLTSVRTALQPRSVPGDSICQPPPGGPQPQASVDDDEFEFDYVESGAKASHTFRIDNRGHYPLCLEQGGTTCVSCTVSRLTTMRVPPGGSAEVTVTYQSSGTEPNFHQSAVILTNDPERPRIELVIKGKTTTPVQVLPRSLYLTAVPANHGTEVKVELFAYFANDLKVLSTEFGESKWAPYFAVRSEPLSADRLQEVKAKSGLELYVTIKPGLPKQTIHQRIRLRTNATHNDVELPVVVKLVGDISVVGPGWNDDDGILTLATIRSSQGVTRNLFVIVRGPHRHDMKVSVGKVVPSWLKVNLGPPREVGAVVQRPLTVSIPKGSPAANHMGSEQGKFAEIELETTHPDIKQLSIFVRMAVVSDEETQRRRAVSNPRR